MAEELNRTLTDHISNFLFAPTPLAKKHLLREGIAAKKIFVVGNTIADAIAQYSKMIDRPICKGKCFGVNFKKNSYMLATIHRPENVDSKESLKEIMKGLRMIYKEYNLPIIYPVHPRTKKMLEQFNLSFPSGLQLIDPVSYLHFLCLVKKARLVLTDSGGVQEECCILKVPCVTMRISTERPETVSAGANIISGTKSSNILKSADIMLKKKRIWKSPFGNGHTAEKIVDLLENKIGY
jgi:UDP-N-acetylglucosamine 2-epimerase (non-hydrolysing)